MKLLRLLVFLIPLLALQSITYGHTGKEFYKALQKKKTANLTKKTADLVDQFGNLYTFEELVVPQYNEQLRNSGGGLCQCGVFQVAFTGFTPDEEATICAVFDYVSGIVTTGPNGDQPIINVVKKPMGASALGLGTTFFTPDCGIVNNFIFDVMNSGASATQPPGTASGVVCINSLIPMYTMNETPSAGEFDLYTITLHEVLHILGFSSQIGPNGDTNQGFYSMWDRFLFSDDDNEFLITPGANPPEGCCDFSQFNPNIIFDNLITADCNMNIFFNINGQNVAEVYGEGAGDLANLLSHLHRCGEAGDQYVMHSSVAPLEERRTLTPEEIAILLAFGYTPTGATDEPCRVIAVDDFFEATEQQGNTSFFRLNIDYDDIVANDNFVDDDGNVTMNEIEIHLTGCGSEGIDGFTPQINLLEERIAIANIPPCAEYEICYTIRGCDEDGDGIPDLCDDGVIFVTRDCLPCLPPLDPCDPPNCGDNLVCHGDFNALSPIIGSGISQSSGFVPCDFERSPDLVYIDATNNAAGINASEVLAVPLMSPIPPGCTASISLLAASQSGAGTLTITASADAPCVEDGGFQCPAPAGANYVCMGDAPTGNGFSSFWSFVDCGPQFPSVDCECIERLPVAQGPITFTPVTISGITNTSDFPLDFIYIDADRSTLLDDISVTVDCENDISITVEQIDEVCVGAATSFEVEICYTGTDQTPVDIELTANLPQIIGVTIVPGSPFDGGSATLTGVVPSPNCIITTFDLFVDFTVPVGIELPISFDVNSPNACLDPQSETTIAPITIACDIPCELAVYPTVTPVCGNQLGCVNFLVAGGSGDYIFIFNGNDSTDPEFCGLAAGQYTFFIVDAEDEQCRIEVEIEIEIDPECNEGCEGEPITVNFSVDDEYCLSSDGTTTQYYLDMHIPNWSGTQTVDFEICSEDVTVEGATVISMIVEDIGFALDIYTVIEIDNSVITDPSGVCFSVPICIDGGEACARFCLEELPECKEGCPFEIIPEIALMTLDAGETCAGQPGSNYLAVGGQIQLTGITWQNVTVEYIQLNGAPIPGGYFNFPNLPNNGGTVTTPSFGFCWNNTFGLEYFCFQIVVTDKANNRECVETFCIPVSEILSTERGSEKGKEFSAPITKTPFDIAWYPNPVKSILNIDNGLEQNVMVSIYNLQGQQIAADRINAYESVQISSSGWPAGLYVLDIRDQVSGQLLKKEKVVIVR